MRYFLKYTTVHNNYSLLAAIEKAAFKLHKKLNNLNINLLNISDYNKNYLHRLIKNGSTQSTLQKYSYLLSWSLAYSSLPLSKFVFLDYGGGTGLLSVLAKELGIGTVIYNDIYDISCQDAKVISQAINNEADYYVCGDIVDLINFMKMQSISCNAIASYDVIEHIYDLEVFLKKLSSLSADNVFNVVMSSGANSSNPIIKKQLMQHHVGIEYKDRNKEYGHKKRDCLRSYFNARKDIISSHVPSLSSTDVERIAKATRGLIASEIRDCVDEYLAVGKITRKPDHPTNTCDPYTGNWAECLMDIKHLKNILLRCGFEVSILNGFYKNSNNVIKVIVGRFLNLLIYLCKDKGIMFAPFFTIYARKL
ncbi:MAG: hypothetical protein U9Q91_04440 [Candidatus Marinimicrobia bacterium]|nr:hypothetical protein [Candidatus Neomarinimicrobiota bacterium]